ncbi:MAG: hypothetical protein FJ224_03110 [Lentisphaerae bacterium]|nr:hypothetical protein [Lentisphaerota bacterium]
MKGSMFAALVMLLAVMFASGCATGLKNAHINSTGGLRDESMTVLSRPLEYGLETLGDASGEAYTKQFLWFVLDGDKVSVDVLLPGILVSDPLERIACYRAAKSLNGDGFYKVTSEWDRISVLGCLYREKRVRVTGKALKIKDLGLMDAKRADEIRKYQGDKQLLIQ